MGVQWMWSGGAHRECHLDMCVGTIRRCQLGLNGNVVVRLIGDGGPDFNLAHWSSGMGLPHHRAVVDGGGKEEGDVATVREKPP